MPPDFGCLAMSLHRMGPTFARFAAHITSGELRLPAVSTGRIFTLALQRPDYKAPNKLFFSEK